MLEGIGSDVLNQMPDGEHSSIAWLIWHAARQQDAQIADPTLLSGYPEAVVASPSSTSPW